MTAAWLGSLALVSFAPGRRYVMAKFVVYADSGGKYRWKLVSSNGQTTASSGESFSSKSSAKNAAERVKASAASADVVEE